MFKCINSIIMPQNVDDYTPMDKTLCISCNPPLLMQRGKDKTYNQISYYDQPTIGMVSVHVYIKQQGLSYQRPHNIHRRPATMSFNLRLFLQKWRVHAYTPSTQFPTQYPSDSTRRLLHIFCHWPHQCQHHRHLKPPQPIVLRQIKQWNPQGR